MSSEPAFSDDLLLAAEDNEDGIYFIRSYDHEFTIGCKKGMECCEEQSAMSLSEALAINLKEAGFVNENYTLIEWLRNHHFRNLMYDHNFDKG